MSDTFDVSSTQLLVEWLRPELERSPLLVPAQDELHSLAQAIQLKSGLGQSEIWALFRGCDTRDLRRFVPQYLLQDLQAITDRRKCGP